MHWTTRAPGVLVAVALALPLAGQQGIALRQPVLGYVFDSVQGKVRAIAGVPGAALIDTPVEAGLILRRADIAPGGLYALVETDADGPRQSGILRWTSGIPERIAAPAMLTGASRVAFSPVASSAALYSETARKVQVWTGFPDKTALAAEIALDETLTSMAVSDDGQGLALAAASSVFAVRPGGSRRQLLDFSNAAVAFRAGSHDLAVAGGPRREVLILSNVLAGAEAETVAQDDAIDAPVAAAFSGDGRKLLIANGGSDSVTEVDLDTRLARTVGCDCRPEGLFRIQGNAVFRLKDSVKSPIFVFDGDSTQGRIVAVPAAGDNQ